MKKQIEEKLKYYENQIPSLTDRFLNYMKRGDRDALIRVRTRVQVYKELLFIEEEKI